MTTKSGTHYIAIKQAYNVLHAVRFANDNGQPLNMMVTLNLTLLGLSDEEAGDFFRKARASVARWWRYERSKGRSLGSLDDVATHEHPKTGRRNVHWLIRLPRGTAQGFEALVTERIQKMLKLDCLGDGVHFMEVTNTSHVSKYMVKGVEPIYADHLHLKEANDQGFIFGRRVHVSRSLGRTARKAAGWKRKRRPRD